MNETNALLKKINGKLGWLIFIILIPYLVGLFWLGTLLLVAIA
jgi:hypothetical protein